MRRKARGGISVTKTSLICRDSARYISCPDGTAVMRYRVFGSLLEGRSFLLSPSYLPPLPRPELLEFRGFRTEDG